MLKKTDHNKAKEIKVNVENDLNKYMQNYQDALTKLREVLTPKRIIKQAASQQQNGEQEKAKGTIHPAHHLLIYNYCTVPF